MTTPAAGAKRIDGGRAGRQYELPDGSRYPSVTSILGVIAKPALVNWAAKEERLLVTQTAGDLWESIAPHQGMLAGDKRISRLGFLNSLQVRLGKSYACQRRLQKASDVGSQAHSLIEWRLNVQLGQALERERPVVSPEANNAFAAFETWADNVKFQPLRIEFMVWSRTYEYAGTLDVVARMEVEGRTVLCLGDWKTGKAIYGEAVLQNAAYIHALREMGHLDAIEDLGEVWGFICRLPKLITDPPLEVRMVSPAEQALALEAFLAARRVYRWQHEPPPVEKTS